MLFDPFVVLGVWFAAPAMFIGWVIRQLRAGPRRTEQARHELARTRRARGEHHEQAVVHRRIAEQLRPRGGCGVTVMPADRQEPR